QPANITFDLLPQLDEETRHKLRRDKKARHALVCERALAALEKHRSLAVAAPIALPDADVRLTEPRP
ncbi:MAG TPA: hypothetical protein VKE70_30295, partial [Candidatus Solibacter sp.]|nr:hypothetical protein [Candidatus Solibacter sp.]